MFVGCFFLGGGIIDIWNEAAEEWRRDWAKRFGTDPPDSGGFGPGVELLPARG